MDNVSIANAGLDKLGVKAIVSFSDDTKQARLCNREFDRLRDLELTLNTWRFSCARASLPALAEAPAFGYDRQFQLPDDFLRLISAGDYAPGWERYEFEERIDAQEYTIEGRQILTDYAAPLKIRYVKRVTDPTEFDSGFIEVLACRIAMELGPSLTDSNPRIEKAMQDYQLALRAAKRANFVQLPPHQIPDDSWLRSRL